MSQGISSAKAPPPVGPYPHARRAGDFIFVSGMGPRKPGTNKIPGNTLDSEGKLISQDVEIQAESTIENIKAVLEEAGSSLEDVVDVTCFLTNMERDFKKFNKVYGRYFEKIGPTRTTVEINCLPTPICVELKAVAYRPLGQN